jgi:hypothetical protein
MAREINKRNTTRKGKSQTIPICRYIILHFKDPKQATRRLLDLITFSAKQQDKKNQNKNSYLLSTPTTNSLNKK